MTTQAKGSLLQRTRRVLGRGYELLTIQEIKLAQALQRKFSFGYLLGRTLGFIVKLALALFLIFAVTWLIAAVFLIFAFLSSKGSSSQETLEDTDEGFCSNQYDYETIGTSEHIAANPNLYDSYGNFK